MSTVPWTAERTAEQVDFDDDYLDQDELPGRPLRKRIGPFTVILLSLALAAAAFYGGVVVEKRNVKSTSSTGAGAGAAAAARFRAAAGAGGAAGLGGGGQGVTGTITLVDGANVYITQSDGTIVKAITSPGSAVTVTSSGTVSSLHPGDSVTVTGPADANGDVTATAIRDNGAGGGGGGGGGGRRGGAATGAGTAATAGGGAPTGPPGG